MFFLTTQVLCSIKFLKRSQAGGDVFLDHTGTQDETWLWHYETETEAQLSVWKTPDTPSLKKIWR